MKSGTRVILVTLMAIVALLSLTVFAVAGVINRSKSTNLTVQLKDFGFVPNGFTVPAGQQVTLAATNAGTVKHEFVILKTGQTASVPWGDADEPKVYWETEVEPGETNVVTFTAPAQPGAYQVVCGQPGHIEAGMTAMLYVQ